LFSDSVFLHRGADERLPKQRCDSLGGHAGLQRDGNHQNRAKLDFRQPQVAEVIAVDDCSTDGSFELLKRLATDEVRLKLHRHARNMGKGAALRTGVGKASAPIVLIQDADLEYDPADYGSLLKPILSGKADAVFGSRFIGSHEHRVLYFWHSVGNQFLTLLSNMTTNLNLTDMEACYKVFKRELIQSLVIEEDRFGFEPEIVAKVARTGASIYEVAISYHGRTYAEGKEIGWKDGVSAIRCILKYGLFCRASSRIDHNRAPGQVRERATGG
jgi:glycosyltransferase involved in cell wall biosynthesis